MTLVGDWGRDCQHYRMVATFHRRVGGRSRRIPAVGKLALPLSVQPVIGARVAAGESLRAVAREYGVSHECIRRMVQASSEQR